MPVQFSNFIRFGWVRRKGCNFAPPGIDELKSQWPRPPMPTIPTLSVGFTSNVASGANTVMPPHRRGPAEEISSVSGKGVAQIQGELFLQNRHVADDGWLRF